MRQLTRRQRMAALALSMLAVCFLALDLGGASLRPAHAGARGWLGALYRGTDGLLGPARRFAQGLPSAGTNEAKIRALEQQNAALRGQLAASAVDARTTAALARLQLAADAGTFRVLPARVVAEGPGEGFDWTVTLDVGTASGVRVGQSVTDGVGLVGRVLHAAPSSSVVLLGADPGSGVGVRDLRTGQVGLATGRGASGFSFVPLDKTAVLRTGDVLATGPVGATSYVPGLAVGVISAIRTSADGTVGADVIATSAPTSLDLVGVILVSATASPRSALAPSGTQAQR